MIFLQADVSLSSVTFFFFMLNLEMVNCKLIETAISMMREFDLLTILV